MLKVKVDLKSSFKYLIYLYHNHYLSFAPVTPYNLRHLPNRQIKFATLFLLILLRGMIQRNNLNHLLFCNRFLGEILYLPFRILKGETQVHHLTVLPFLSSTGLIIFNSLSLMMVENSSYFSITSFDK